MTDSKDREVSGSEFDWIEDELNHYDSQSQGIVFDDFSNTDLIGIGFSDETSLKLVALMDDPALSTESCDPDGTEEFDYTFERLKTDCMRSVEARRRDEI